MPFKLKKVGATYQTLMDAMFSNLNREKHGGLHRWYDCEDFGGETHCANLEDVLDQSWGVTCV